MYLDMCLQSSGCDLRAGLRIDGCVLAFHFVYLCISGMALRMT